MLGWWRSKSRLEIAKVVVPILLLAVFVFFLFFWRLGSLTKGLSPAEVSAGASSSSVQTIIDSPVYGPYKILAYSVQKVFGLGPLALRSVSAVSAILFIFCFYHLVKGWFGKLISLFATVFFATTPWFVLLARNGGPEIFLFMPIVVLAAYYWLTRSSSRNAWLALIVSSVLCLYLPGGLFLILIGGLSVRRILRQTAAKVGSQNKIMGGLIFVLILAPLVYSVIRNPRAVEPLLLIPYDWPSAWVMIKSIAWQILAIYWRTPTHADFIVGRLPIFNGAQIALAIFGGFALFKLARNKLYLIVGLASVGILAAAVNQNLVLLSLAVPATVLCIAGGLRYLYMQWRSVFPKNPLPKYLALCLITTLCAMQVFYGLRYSLIAWPNSSATRNTYVLK